MTEPCQDCGGVRDSTSKRCQPCRVRVADGITVNLRAAIVKKNPADWPLSRKALGLDKEES